MKLFASESLMTRMGMEVVTCSASSATVQMPIAGNTQIHGILHGGAAAALVETAASLAASEHAKVLSPDGDLIAVGTSLSISHLRPAVGGNVTAHAIAEHLGHTRTVHRVTVENEDGKIVSSALVSNRIIVARES